MDGRGKRETAKRRVAQRAPRGDGRGFSDIGFEGLVGLCEWLERVGFNDGKPRIPKGGSESGTELRRKLLWAVSSTYNLKPEGVAEIIDRLGDAIHQVWVKGLL